MKIRNVVSLFNGMSTLQQAMANSNIEYENYYSSEIKKYAIELNQHHFPDTIQLGDINNWREWNIDWSRVDFIGSGSPCQDLSICGNRSGLDGSRSSLFFTFIEILNHVRKLNPNVVFLQENVGSATKMDVGIMSREMGVYPVRINSSLITAQLRDRYYWTNIRTRQTMFDLEVDIPQPKDLGYEFQDVLTSGTTDREKALAILEQERTIRTKHDHIIKRINSGESRENYIFDNDIYRPCNLTELCRLQGFPDDYCDTLPRRQGASLLGDGWTLPMIEYILSFYKL